ncbi:APC family permease [Halopenitus sp. POP-27]|uniref:APC family permease n=1 Tax=Halopenitus sp. POP-27 TaxID=2994425 RepID=UPI00246835C4|nr:APC family permease [Halopenitus sp. POP-27]
MSQIEETKIGFVASIAAAVGISVGGGLWVTPVVAGSMAGPAVLALGLLVAVPIFLAFPAYFTLIKAWPRSGGHYFYPSRLLFPESKSLSQLAGWLSVWLMTSLSAVSIIQYMYIPGAQITSSFTPLSTQQLILSMMAFSFIVVWFGLRIAGAVEIVLSTLLLLSIVVIVGPGLQSIDPANLAPETTPSIGGMAAAFALLYSVAAASFYTIDFSGGVKDAKDKVTKSIAIASVTNISAATLVGFVSVGIISYTDLADQTLAFVSLQYLPTELIMIVGFGAALAGITSGIMLIMVLNRYVEATSADGLLPDILAETNRYGEPKYFLALLFLVAASTTFLSLPLSVLATALTLALLSTFSIGPLIGVRLSSQFPEVFEREELRSTRLLTPTLVRRASIAAVAINALSFVYVSLATPTAFFIYLGLVATGVAIYAARRYQADVLPNRVVDLSAD